MFEEVFSLGTVVEDESIIQDIKDGIFIFSSMAPSTIKVKKFIHPQIKKEMYIVIPGELNINDIDVEKASRMMMHDNINKDKFFGIIQCAMIEAVKRYYETNDMKGFMSEFHLNDETFH